MTDRIRKTFPCIRKTFLQDVVLAELHITLTVKISILKSHYHLSLSMMAKNMELGMLKTAGTWTLALLIEHAGNHCFRWVAQLFLSSSSLFDGQLSMNNTVQSIAFYAYMLSCSL